MVLAIEPDSWEARLSEITPGHPPDKLPRYLYLCKEVTLDWRALVPEGYSVRRIDRELVGDSANQAWGVMDVLAVDGGQSAVRIRHSGAAADIEVPGVSRLEGDTIAAVAAAVVLFIIFYIARDAFPFFRIRGLRELFTGFGTFLFPLLIWLVQVRDMLPLDNLLHTRH
mgnify:CR=1 FL=1